MIFSIELINRFLELSPMMIRIIMIAIIVLVILTALTLFLGFFQLCWYILQRIQRIYYPLSLANQGNIQTTFHLRMDMGEAKKQFKPIILLKKKRLRWKTIEQVTYEEELPKPVKEKRSKRVEKEKKNSMRDNAKKEYQKVNGFLNLIASISTGLATLLPGSLKKPFKAVSDSIRGGQQEVSSAMVAPKQVESSAKQLKTNVSRLGSSNQSEKTSKQSEPAAKQRIVVNKYDVIEVPALAPGEIVSLRLILQPRNPFRRLEGLFSVNSHQLEQKEFPMLGELQSKTVQASYTVRKLSIIYAILFVLLTLTAGLSIGGSLYIFILWAVNLL